MSLLKCKIGGKALRIAHVLFAKSIQILHNRKDHTRRVLVNKSSILKTYRNLPKTQLEFWCNPPLVLIFRDSTNNARVWCVVTMGRTKRKRTLLEGRVNIPCNCLLHVLLWEDEEWKLRLLSSFSSTPLLPSASKHKWLSEMKTWKSGRPGSAWSPSGLETPGGTLWGLCELHPR